MSAHDRARYRAKRRPEGRIALSKIRQLEKELAAHPPVEPPVRVAPIPAAVDRLMTTHAAGAAMRKAEQVAEWERLELEDETRADFVPSFASRWNGEWCRGKSRATEAPTQAESDALFAWEREHLGVDRHTGAVRKLG